MTLEQLKQTVRFKDLFQVVLSEISVFGQMTPPTQAKYNALLSQVTEN